MSDQLPTVWSADPHTLAKHQILRGYLQAWMPILASGRRPATFIDAFAGPGRYAGGQPGSPIIAIETAIEHSHSFLEPVRFLFIEEDAARFAELQRTIASLRPRIQKSANIHLLSPVNSACQDVLEEMLDKCDREHQPFGPSLVFLDQFGYSDVPMALISRIMKHPQCEIFSYMNWQRLGPYMSDDTKHSAFTRAVGNDAWNKCLKLKGHSRSDAFRRAYSEQLRRAGNVQFVWHFAMCGDGGQLLNWMFFCTNSVRGLEEMKRAMWKVDNSGTFRFSDGDNPDQLGLFSGATSEWLANHLAHHFDGRTVSVSQIREYVLIETPCFSFKESLATLEREGRITVISPGKRKKGTFPDDAINVRFEPPPKSQLGLFG